MNKSCRLGLPIGKEEADLDLLRWPRRFMERLKDAGLAVLLFLSRLPQRAAGAGYRYAVDVEFPLQCDQGQRYGDPANSWPGSPAVPRTGSPGRHPGRDPQATEGHMLPVIGRAPPGWQMVPQRYPKGSPENGSFPTRVRHLGVLQDTEK